MNSGDYRREYAAFCRAFEHERYEYHAGLVAEPAFKRVFERFADIWTRESIEDLRRALKEIPGDFETERAALRALLFAAQCRYVEGQAGELREELARCESAAKISWEGRGLNFAEMPERIASETEGVRRRELAARWFDAISSCDDMRAEILASRQESARSLGFDSHLALRQEIGGANFETLAGRGDAFIRRTDAAYHSRLAAWAAIALPPAVAPHFADSLFFRRMTSLDALFAARDPPVSYGAAMNALGIRVERQANIRVDTQPRPSKQTDTACFGVSVPDEVYVVVGAGESGLRLFRNFFEATGRAQAYAWSSRELAARYPEFIHAPDAATREGYAILLRRLFLDAPWLVEHCGLRASEAGEVARACALLETHDARLCCARLRYCLSLDAATGTRSEQIAESYVTLHTEATGFRYQPETSLLDAEVSFRAAERLRGHLFGAALGEHLRAKYGRRWWASRRAGDELIDMWNTGSRYGVEELARLSGVGELDFDLLADNLTAALDLN